MAHLKSSKKDILRIEVNTARNRHYKTRFKTFYKKVIAAVTAGNLELAQAAFREFESNAMKIAGKGIIHKNSAARRVSRLNAKVKALKLGGTAKAAA